LKPASHVEGEWAKPPRTSVLNHLEMRKPLPVFSELDREVQIAVAAIDSVDGFGDPC
jgi:hypothetical protein